MCNNNGHCRKFDAGTCARAIASRATSSIRRAGAPTRCASRCRDSSATRTWASEAVQDGARSVRLVQGLPRECPTGVDMAKMKIESLAAYNQRHGVPLRERLIAHLPRYAPMVSRVAWLANLLTRIPGAARLAESWLGLSARRRLPAWHGSLLRRMSSDKAGAAPGVDGREVVLFVDTFSNYFAHRGRGRRAPRARSRRIHGAHQRDAGRTPAVLRTNLSRRGPGRRGEGRGAADVGSAGALRAARRGDRRARAIVPARHARRIPELRPGRGRGAALAPARCCSRSFWCANVRPDG